jgi:hypothetical protein
MRRPCPAGSRTQRTTAGHPREPPRDATRRCTARRAGTPVAMVGPVPAQEHEIYVELFRQQPALAIELLRICAGIELRGAVELTSADFAQVVPTEFRADAVVVVRDASAAITAGIVVEVQLGAEQARRPVRRSRGPAARRP